nr:hypothetical protein [Desulfobacula sp.]
MTWSSDNNRGLSTHDVFYDHYNLPNINTSETQNTRTVETAYDNNGNLTGILYPSGKAIARTYNAVNLLESVTNTTQTLARLRVISSMASMTRSWNRFCFSSSISVRASLICLSLSSSITASIVHV